MLKRLAGCIRQYKGVSLLSPLFVVLEVVMESAIFVRDIYLEIFREEKNIV